MGPPGAPDETARLVAPAGARLEEPAAPARSLALQRLAIVDLRSIARATLEPAARLNVLYGRNGHGKTTVLEAIYLAATSRSFRTHRAAELIRHGAPCAVVRACFTEEGGPLAPLSREQVASIQGGSCAVQLDGKRPGRLAEYATRSPVIAFHPEEMTLSTGPAAGRRTLLDRIALFLDPRSAEHRARYGHALRARQRLLQGPAPSAATEAPLEAFEALCAEHGAALTRARRVAADALTRRLEAAFRHLAAPELTLTAVYEPGGSEEAAEARLALRAQRARDAFRASAGHGPHRDDLGLSLDGKPCRVVASQGQHRAVTLALKLAELQTVGAACRLEPLLLLDDVSSELDEDRTAALFALLERSPGQIFVTTTRPELIVSLRGHGGDRLVLRVENGSVQRGENG